MVQFDDQFCKEVMRNYFIKETKFEILNYVINNNLNVKGFSGEHKLLKITVKQNEKQKSYQFFMKTAGENDSIMVHYEDVGCFKKEIYVFNEVIDKLEMMLEKKLTAKCYFANNNILVLEDLTLINYEPYRGQLDLNHVSVILKSFAEIHAASILYELTNKINVSEEFNKLTTETFIAKNSESIGLMYSVREHIKCILEKFFNEKFNTREINKFIEWLFDICFSHVKASNEYRNVICHGDPWENNFLIRYDDERNPRKCCFVDFQGTRIFPPAAEIIQFMYLNMPKKFREENENFIIDNYFKEFNKILTCRGYLTKNILSKAEFTECFHAYKKFGVTINVLYTVFTVIPVDLLRALSVNELVKFVREGDADVPLKAFATNLNYKNKLTDAIEEAYDCYKHSVSN